MLVGKDQLVDEPVAEERVLGIGGDVHVLKYVESSLPDLLHVGAAALAAEDGQLVARGAGVLDRVVEEAEVAVHGLELADLLDQPQLLEVGDMAEVPGERAE